MKFPNKIEITLTKQEIEASMFLRRLYGFDSHLISKYCPVVHKLEIVFDKSLFIKVNYNYIFIRNGMDSYDLLCSYTVPENLFNIIKSIDDLKPFDYDHNYKFTLHKINEKRLVW